MSRRATRLAALAAGVLVVGAGLGALAPTADAETPQQQAAALAKQVSALQQQAEQDAEAYDQAEGELGEVTAAQFAAERAATAAQSADATARQAGSGTVRQLFEMGGPATLYTAVLAGGGSPFAVQSQLIAAGRVLSADQRAVATTDARSQSAVAAQERADALADEQTQLEQEVAARSTQVQQTLARTQQLLAGADAQVVAIEQADAAAAAAADHAAFLQQLTAARSGSSTYAAALDTAPPASSTVAATALAAAEALEGHPYQWGGTGPVGYDCSGMTGAAYAAAGVNLPRTAAQQYLAGPHVPLADLEPGDLLFWAFDPADPSTIHHVAIYAGNGLMVSADHTGDTVRLQPVWWDGYAGATRPAEAQALLVAGPRWVAGTGD